MDAYVEHRRDRLAFKQLRNACRRVVERIGHLPAAGVRAADVRAYAARRKAEGMAPGTIAEELRKLNTALRWAESEELIARAPKIRTPPGGAARRRYLSVEECARLVAAAKTPHVRLFILIALHTGARRDAILELEWSRVDLERGVVDFGRKEGGKERAVVPATATLLEVLREAHACRRTPFVIEYAGARVKSMLTGWRLTLRRAGIAHCTRHDLRRTAGSLLVQAGVPMEVVARMLGHSSIATTSRVYAHLRTEDLRLHVKELDRALQPAGIASPGDATIQPKLNRAARKA